MQAGKGRTLAKRKLKDSTPVAVAPRQVLNARIRSSADEERYVLIGTTFRGRLVVVVHTDREGATRLISARMAEPRERRRYEQD
jgi:uncharacterized DUF497 family protein